MKDLEYSLKYFNDRYRALIFLKTHNEAFTKDELSLYKKTTLDFEVQVSIGITKLEQGHLSLIPELSELIQEIITFEEKTNKRIQETDSERYHELFDFMVDRAEEFKTGFANYNKISEEAFFLQKSVIKASYSVHNYSETRRQQDDIKGTDAYERLMSQNFVKGYSYSETLDDAQVIYLHCLKLHKETKILDKKKMTIKEKNRIESLAALKDRIESFELTLMLNES